jgi:hypothetical protein
MSSLEERLKQLRQSAAAAKTTVKASNATGSKVTGDLTASDNDEVADLLRRTKDELAVEQDKSVTVDDEDDIEAWLAQDSDGGEELQDHAVQSIEEETDKLTRAAEEALKGLQREGVLKEATNAVLQIDPKDRPVLSRTPSNASHSKGETGTVSLEEDLADAMAEDVGSIQASSEAATHTREEDVHAHSTGKIEDNNDELGRVSKELDQLTTRLAFLRSNSASLLSPPPSTSHNEGSTPASLSSAANDFAIDLPSAPNTKPIDIGGGDWKDKRGVQGRDLSSYEALVRLNATNLGMPKESSLSSKEQGESDNKEDDDQWCCICNEDAILSCLGCDDDLYCRKCWNEGHLSMDKEELQEHQTKWLAGHRRKKITAM